MNSNYAFRWIVRWRKRRIAIFWLENLLISSSIAVLLTAMANFLKVDIGLSPFFVFAISFSALYYFQPIRNITLRDVATQLDRHYPALEESCSLIIREQDSLDLLEKLQLQKIEKQFPLKKSFAKSLKRLFLYSILFLLVSALNFVPLSYSSLSQANSNNEMPVIKMPEGLKHIKIRVEAPDYTKLPPFEQQKFALKVPIGSRVTWKFQPSNEIQKIQIIFNQTETYTLKSNREFSKLIASSGFYQLNIDGKLSDLYAIETIPDLPVTIEVQKPSPHTTIDFGQEPILNLSVLLRDDYGISDAFISTTLARGKGEGVSFSARKLNFNQSFQGKRQSALRSVISLQDLGMKGGDELYLFIEAKDNAGQQSRSDVYTITMVDTAALMSMSGMSTGVDLVPEYFRSQRQIIIDTEKLLKEWPSISLNSAKERSNSLGTDQKLLRLRYGKFLGEEFESGGGDEDGHEHEEEHSHEEIPIGDAKAMMDQYAHKHDVAEDATFFEPELKAQLKAVLNEMWKAELNLRTFKLKEALPYEYKALRLLKDLQQKSRVYVAKTSIKTPKLKAEKRLSGELQEILTLRSREKVKNENSTTLNIKALLAYLQTDRPARRESAMGNWLASAEKEFVYAARQKPSTFLPAMRLLRKLDGKSALTFKEKAILNKALNAVLGTTYSSPAQNTKLYNRLSDSYFNELGNGYK